MKVKGMPHSLRKLANSIASGQTTAEEHALECLTRMERMPWVGALLKVASDQVLEDARAADVRIRSGEPAGSLSGLLFAVKDNIDVAGHPTTACTPALAHNMPRADADVVARLKAAGAIVIGKAVMHELAMGGTSNNPHMAIVRNPHAEDRIAGGSSGGSAAAVAAGFCAFTLGSDTGGSVPIPASLCGIAGLRPSVGRYSVRGLLAANPSRDVIGPIARTADDLRLIDAVISGLPEAPAPRLATIKLAMPRRLWEKADVQVTQALREALDSLVSANVSLLETVITDLDSLNEAAAAGFRIESSLNLHEVLATLSPAQSVENLICQTRSPSIADALTGIAKRQGDPRQLQDALNVHRPQLRAAIEKSMDDVGADALLVPTTPLPAIPIGSEAQLTINGRPAAFFSYTQATLPAANAGLPFLSVPAAFVDGLPVGLGLIGRHDGDAGLLAIGTSVDARLNRYRLP
jgi:mandelamide amidase